MRPRGRKGRAGLWGLGPGLPASKRYKSDLSESESRWKRLPCGYEEGSGV